MFSKDWKKLICNIIIVFFLNKLTISILSILFFFNFLLLLCLKFEIILLLVVKFLLSFFLYSKYYIIAFNVLKILNSIVKFVWNDLSLVIQIFSLNFLLDFVHLELIIINSLLFFNLHQLFIKKVNLILQMFIRFLLSFSICIISQLHPI